MDFSPGPKQISSTQVNQLIEAAVENRIKERSLKEDVGKGLTKRLFPEDDQDDEERFKVLYQERLEQLTQADEKMKEKQEENMRR